VSTSPAGESRGRARNARGIDLRAALLEHATALSRAGGPEAVSLREVQRRAGVSAAAAYRHYRDREALLEAVGRRASALLADTIGAAIDAVPPGLDARGRAIARLRAGCKGYLAFARREPGLLQAIFLTGEAMPDLRAPAPPSPGAGGLGPYVLLLDCIADLVATGVMPADRVAWSDIAAWAAVHGFAVLLREGPLRHLDDAGQQAAAARVVDVLLAGLAGDPPEGCLADPPGGG